MIVLVILFRRKLKTCDLSGRQQQGQLERLQIRVIVAAGHRLHKTAAEGGGGWSRSVGMGSRERQGVTTANVPSLGGGKGKGGGAPSDGSGGMSEWAAEEQMAG